jgi:hypothetical protein
MKKITIYIIAMVLLVSYLLLAPDSLKLLSGAFCTGVVFSMIVNKLFDLE